MLNITIINAYIVWVNQQRPLPSNLKFFSHKAFKLKRIHALCDGHNWRKQGVKGVLDVAVHQVIIRNLKPGHFLIKFNGHKKECVACRRAEGKVWVGYRDNFWMLDLCSVIVQTGPMLPRVSRHAVKYDVMISKIDIILISKMLI